MEAFGAAVSVLTVLELTQKALFFLYDSHRTIKSADDDRKNIIRDIRDLERVLNRVLDIVSDDQRVGYSKDHMDKFFIYLESKESPIRACRDEISAIYDKLKKHQGAILWLLRKNDIQERLQNLERYKGRLVAAMQASSMETILAIESILHAQSDMLASHVQRESDKAILTWLDAPDVQSNLIAAVEKRQPGTGDWLLESEPYKQWFASPQFLWLTGLPGSGKTVISSTIIATLLRAVQGSLSAVTYFYFDFHAEMKREPKALLLGVLSQLAAQDTRASEQLRDLHKECSGGQQQPAREELLLTTRRALGYFTSVYIVVDALDECVEPSAAVEMLRYLSEASNAHVMAVSRKDVDLERAMRGTIEIKLEGRGVDDDIANYVRHRLLMSEYMQSWPLVVKERVVALLKSKSESMFRWAQCQLDAIEKCSDSSQIDEALAGLPPNLPSTYERILTNVGQYSARNVYKVLSCLAFAFRPFTLDEIKNILQIDAAEAVKVTEKVVFTAPLLSSCSSLVSTGFESPSSPELRLAHFSVKEYLISDAIATSTVSSFAMSPAKGHREMAEACVACLLHFDSIEDFGPETLEKHPFLLYAAYNWIQHAQLAQTADPRGCLDELIFDLFQNKADAYVNWIRLYAPDAPSRGIRWTSHIVDGQKRDKDWLTRSHHMRTPLYNAARSNLWRVVEKLLRAGNDANAWTKGNWSAFHIAAHEASFESMQILLDVGKANVNQGCWIGSTPLHVAAETARNPQAVAWLLLHGADPRRGTDVSGTPLQAAAYKDAHEVVAALLRAGVDPNFACEHYHDETVTLCTPLQCAAYVGGLRSMELLLGFGAHLERHGVECKIGSALHAAALGGQMEAVKFLLDRGVSPHLNSGQYGTVLSAAAFGGNRDMLEFMLGAGVRYDDMHHRNSEKKQPWAEMDADEQRDLVDAIISNAGEIFCPDLLTAAKMGCAPMVRRFLDQKAPIEKMEKFHRRTPLNWAAANGHLEVVKLLAEAGASVRSLNRFNQSPFISSCIGGHLDVAKYLLTKGVDWRHRDSRFRTGLMYAEMGGHVDLTEFLRGVESAGTY